MSVLGIIAQGAVSDGGMRSMLLILLVLAVVFLVIGAVLAIVALRNQRKVVPNAAALEQLDGEVS